MVALAQLLSTTPSGGTVPALPHSGSPRFVFRPYHSLVHASNISSFQMCHNCLCLIYCYCVLTCLFFYEKKEKKVFTIGSLLKYITILRSTFISLTNCTASLPSFVFFFPDHCHPFTHPLTHPNTHTHTPQVLDASLRDALDMSEMTRSMVDQLILSRENQSTFSDYSSDFTSVSSSSSSSPSSMGSKSPFDDSGDSESETRQVSRSQERIFIRVVSRPHRSARS